MSLKTGFAQIFSCCPKNLSCPKFGGPAAPLAPPGSHAYGRLDFMQTNFATFWIFPKRFYHSFVLQVILIQAAGRKYTCAIPKHMKTYESG